MKRMSRWFPVIALLMSLNLLSCGSDGESAANLLDTLFGTGGMVTTAIGTDDDVITALKVQSDGKLVAAGYSFDNALGRYVFALVRYNNDGTNDGTLDASFGTGGIVKTSIGTVDDRAYALVIQPDDKLVVAGYSYNSIAGAYEFALVRYNTDGSLDTTFNTTGKVTTAVGTEEDTAYALAIQPDGKLVAAGYSYNSIAGSYEFALVRYNTDGSLDTTFNTTGKVTTAVGTEEGTAFALAIQSDDKPVAAGYFYNSTAGAYEFALVRYNPDGTLDSSFDTDGIVTTAIGTVEDVAYALAIQSDDKLVAAGYSDSGTQFELALVRYNTDGTLDSTFDADGKVTTAIGNIDDEVFALAVQSDDKLIAAGYSDNGTQRRFALTRYNTNGNLDMTFNKTGKIITTIGDDDVANAVAIQPSDGKLVAAGKSVNNDTGVFEFAVVRYRPIP